MGINVLKNHRLLIISALLAAMPAAVSAADYYLYAPKKVEEGKAPASPSEGVLVKSITLRPGDTLSSISRSFSGKGSYFPQILLFNSIKNPDLIYAGATLLVPVTAKEAVIGRVAAGKTHAKGRRKGHKVPLHTSSSAKAPEVAPPAASAPVVQEERVLYNRAVALYEKKRYDKALGLFERFLREHPKSPLAPDAALYKANCYDNLAGN